MMEHDDRDLQERFAVQRRDDAAGLTPLGVLLERERAPLVYTPRRRAVLAPLAAALAVVALAIHFIGRYPRAPLVDLAAVRWVAPTDFLLQLPGADLLRTVPSFISLPSATDRRIP